MNIQSFITRNAIRMTSEWADENPNMADMPAGSSHYKCTFRKGSKQMTVYFSQGPAICREPTAKDVLDCLASDATADLTSFEDFCSEFGYDVDSRRAERTFNAIKRQTEKLQRFLNGTFEQLIECDRD
jgi:hypothetical protein